jgi:hypothetical protein
MVAFFSKLQCFGNYFSGFSVASCGKLGLNELLLFGLEGDGYRLVDVIVISIISIEAIINVIPIFYLLPFYFFLGSMPHICLSLSVALGLVER